MGTGACIRCVTNPSSIVQGVGSQLVGKPQIHGFTQGGFFFSNPKCSLCHSCFFALSQF